MVRDHSSNDGMVSMDRYALPKIEIVRSIKDDFWSVLVMISCQQRMHEGAAVGPTLPHQVDWWIFGRTSDTIWINVFIADKLFRDSVKFELFVVKAVISPEHPYHAYMLPVCSGLFKTTLN